MKPSKRLAKTVAPKIQMVMTLSACLLIGRNGHVALPCNATLGDKSKNPRLIAQVMFSHVLSVLPLVIWKLKKPCREKEPTVTNGRRKGWWRALVKMGSHNPSLVAKAWCTSVSAINAIYGRNHQWQNQRDDAASIIPSCACKLTAPPRRHQSWWPSLLECGDIEANPGPRSRRSCNLSSRRIWMEQKIDIVTLRDLARSWYVGSWPFSVQTQRLALRFHRHTLSWQVFQPRTKPSLLGWCPHCCFSKISSCSGFEHPWPGRSGSCMLDWWHSFGQCLCCPQWQQKRIFGRFTFSFPQYSCKRSVFVCRRLEWWGLWESFSVSTQHVQWHSIPSYWSHPLGWKADNWLPNH